MRHLYAFFTVFLLCGTRELSLAQWTTSGTTITNTNTGNVGIGTTSPATKLDVRGGETSVDYLNVYPQDNTNGEGGEISLKGASGNPNWQIDLLNDQFRLHSSGSIRLSLGSDGNATINGGLYLGSNSANAYDGYLRIGNLTKSSSPTVQNWGEQSTMILNAQAYSTIAFHHSGARVDFIRAGNRMIQLGYDGGWGAAHIGLPNGLWTSDGNVGIGSTSPVSRLHVTGGGLVLGTHVNPQNTDGYLSLGDMQTSSTPTNQTWGTSTTLLLNGQDYSTIGFHDAGMRVDFIRSGNGTIQLGYDGGYGAANIGLPNGVWNSIGNVGIGTTNPGAYKLAVEGKIGAREVEVKTGSWADFVFDKSYALPSLIDVEAHIEANHHLPGIPSESEVKETGYALGAMDAKLLQKIEELTLYVIQQQKEIDQLKRLTKPKKGIKD